MPESTTICRVGIIGCGDISAQYIRHLRTFDDVVLIACADLDRHRAAQCALRWDLLERSVSELLASPDIDVIANLTPPKAHFAVTRAALMADKDVYSEKPLATDLVQAEGLAALARHRGRSLACAPDTFLSAAYTGARELIRNGEIGDVVAVSMSGLYGPPEEWHPDPRFLYAPGAGPLFDMGPYFLHALFHLLGPVAAVSAAARTPRPWRRIGTGPLAGTEFQASTPTHLSALLTLASGPVVSWQMSFDVAATSQPFFEIQGTAGTLVLPDPEDPDGDVRLFGSGGWSTVPAAGHPAHLRGAGLIEMVRAARLSRPTALPMQFAVHAVEVLQAVLASAEQGKQIALQTGLDEVAEAAPSR